MPVKGMRTLTPEQERWIVDRYGCGETALEISKAFTNVSVDTIRTTLRRYGVAIRPGRNTSKRSEEERAAIVQACLNGEHVKAVAERFYTSPETVFRILKANKITLRRGRPREYEINDRAFDILTPQSSYWMGFLFADGCVHYDEYGSPLVAIALAEKDRHQLEKLQTFLESTHPVRRTEKTETSMGGPFADFRVRSKRLAAALVAQGMEGKETRVPSVDLAASPDFWRGYMDGDGSLGTALWHDKYLYPYIGMFGHKPLLEKFQVFLMINGCARLEIYPTESGIWRIMTCGLTAEAIIKMLYGDAGVGLDRKMARAQAIISGDISKSVPYIEEPSSQKIDNAMLAEWVRTEQLATAE